MLVTVRDPERGNSEYQEDDIISRDRSLLDDDVSIPSEVNFSVDDNDKSVPVDPSQNQGNTDIPTSIFAQIKLLYSSRVYTWYVG